MPFSAAPQHINPRTSVPSPHRLPAASTLFVTSDAIGTAVAPPLAAVLPPPTRSATAFLALASSSSLSASRRLASIPFEVGASRQVKYAAKATPAEPAQPAVA